MGGRQLAARNKILLAKNIKSMCRGKMRTIYRALAEAVQIDMWEEGPGEVTWGSDIEAPYIIH